MCPVCSVLNAPGANFCTACGAELPESDDRATGAYPLLGVDIPAEGEVGQLVVTRGPTAGSRYALGAAVTTIGRHPDSGIFLDDVTVSRRHAEIRRTPDGQYLAADAGSLNGTYLDGERIEEAAMREGAQLQVGKYRLVFVIGTLGGGA
ncbi:MAG: FHA domain-containing protein [Actinobacteria bacterium]|nr:FHA domain-containing protein [Actinomycetota bacterium]